MESRNVHLDISGLKYIKNWYCPDTFRCLIGIQGFLETGIWVLKNLRNWEHPEPIFPLNSGCVSVIIFFPGLGISLQDWFGLDSVL